MIFLKAPQDKIKNQLRVRCLFSILSFYLPILTCGMQAQKYFHMNILFIAFVIKSSSVAHICALSIENETKI